MFTNDLKRLSVFIHDAYFNNEIDVYVYETLKEVSKRIAEYICRKNVEALKEVKTIMGGEVWEIEGIKKYEAAIKKSYEAGMKKGEQNGRLKGEKSGRLKGEKSGRLKGNNQLLKELLTSGKIDQETFDEFFKKKS